eukprot:s1486_g17.t1
MGRSVGRSLRMVFGAPAPARSIESAAGTWTGVCALSDFPCSSVSVDWPDGVFQCGRTLISSHYVGSTHVVVGTIYGAAQSPTFRNPLEITQSLLRSLTDEVVHKCRGPRCIMGDFNCGLLQLPEMDYWRSLGWQEIQIHSQQLFHQPVQPTCKQVTVRDYLWCSPELLQYFCSTAVLPGLFPDHSAICGFFRFPGHQPCTWTWTSPKPLPWASIRADEWRAAVDSSWTPYPWTADTTKDFGKWSHQVEKSLTSFVATPHGKLPPGCGGRGQQLNRHRRSCVQPAIKPHRPGEEPLHCSFPNRHLLQWYRQLRRLQSLVHSCRTGVVTDAAWSYQAQCWSAIVRAPGFRPSFRQWWTRRPIQLQSSPSSLLGLPPLAVLEHVFLDFRLNFRSMETWYIKQRAKLVQVRRETSLKDLFRTMKPAGSAPLDFLCASQQYPIQAIQPATGAVLLDGAPAFDTGLWVFAGERVHPCPVEDPDCIEVDRTWCTFESDRLPVPGGILTNLHPVPLIPDIHKHLLDFWAKRWQALSTVPDNAWTRIIAFVRAYVPRHVLPCPPISSTDLRAIFRSKSGLQTGGPDGWRKEDILNLPDSLLTDITNLFSFVEGGGSWPTQLTRGHVTCLQKKAGSFDVANFRPIVVFSLWYRLWGCLRARHYLAQLEQIADFPAYGFLAGRGCQDITFAIQAAVETALRQGLSCCGALFDIEKCFNCIPRAPIMFLARWLGLDGGVVHAWSSFLKLMHRSFMIHGAPSEAIGSDHGLPEGDSMSCVGMLLLNFS